METIQKIEKEMEDKLGSFKATKIVDVEISQPLPVISSLNGNGEQIYQRGLILARLHTIPIGLLSLDFSSDQILPAQLADQLWSTFGKQIDLHLQEDGISPIEVIPESGIVSEGRPKCFLMREALLKDAPFMSIIIATRDRVQSLSNVLNSILALEYPKFEVILVDNAPKSDETHKFFEFIQPRFIRRDISLCYIRENTPGLAVAHNRGLELVRGSIVAFTDDDVLVDKNWLVELLRGFQAAQSVGCVTGLVVPVELETPAQVLFEEYGGFVKGFEQKIYDLNGHRPDHSLYPYTPGLFGTGANMAYQVDLLKKSGGFDPALGIGTPSQGADDLAAFFQIIDDGNQLVYQPSAVVFHQHRRSYESLRKQMYGYGTGLTVFLTKCVLDNPKRLIDIASKASAGLKYAMAPDSPKNNHKSINYPRELEWIERRGMLNGPIAYLKSKWRYRKHKTIFSDPGLDANLSTPQHYLVHGWADDINGEKRTKEL